MVFPKETLINNSPKNISSKCTLKQFYLQFFYLGIFTLEIHVKENHCLDIK